MSDRRASPAKHDSPSGAGAVGAAVTFVVAFAVGFLWLSSSSLWLHLLKTTVLALVCAGLVAKWGDAAVSFAIRILWHSR